MVIKYALNDIDVNYRLLSRYATNSYNIKHILSSTRSLGSKHEQWLPVERPNNLSENGRESLRWHGSYPEIS